jgi:hypothetical protein
MKIKPAKIPPQLAKLRRIAYTDGMTKTINRRASRRFSLPSAYNVEVMRNAEKLREQGVIAFARDSSARPAATESNERLITGKQRTAAA